MAPVKIDHPQTRLILFLLLIVNIFPPTLKVLSALKGDPIANLIFNASTNGMNIATIGKYSVHVSIMYIAPTNTFILHKASSFEHLVWTVSLLKGLHNSFKLIHFMSQQLTLDTIYTLQGT